ncbi:hypothetical protein ACFLXY_06400 [Chloroflexota bacterium]
MQVDERDWDKVTKEIEQCQSRVLQTLVPTVLALGLIGFSGMSMSTESSFPPYFAMGATFAVLLATSLYIASLSYKIFMNGTFLSVFAPKQSDIIYWERVVKLFRGEPSGKPKIIHSETTTAGTIYMILALTYIFIFASIDAVRESLGALIFLIISGIILLGVAFTIFWTYQRYDTLKANWEKIKEEKKYIETSRE